MMKTIFTTLFTCAFIAVNAQFPAAYSDQITSKAEIDELTRAYLAPQRIVWITSDTLVTGSESLLNKGNSQAYFGRQPVCKIINPGGDRSGMILDFGIEIQGGIQITTSLSNRVTPTVRIRFGESVSETCSEVSPLGGFENDGGATNHHAMRDFEITLPGYGTLEIGNTGYRFVRIDLVDPDTYVAIKEIRAVAVYRDNPYLGSFTCSDVRLNRIWETAAYTVHVTMQDYLWDGIKRDRMVWAGDMHPEIMAINRVFGYNEVVPKSLDFLRDHTPLPAYMNGISSYSMWWVIMQHDWFMYHGDRTYLEKQKEYLLPLLEQFTGLVNDTTGKEMLESAGWLFLDWPSSTNKEAVHAGLQGLMVMTFEKGAYLCQELGEPEKAASYNKIAMLMGQYQPDPGTSKQAASLLVLSGIADAKELGSEVIAAGGPENFSTFFGYYMLEALAVGGYYTEAMNIISQYWGGMLDMGATTFWEDFDLSETVNASPIDQLTPADMIDYYRTTGMACFIGLRRSLCHGWAAGPAPWLSEHVLGIKVLEPGCSRISIEPHLGKLDWAEGTFPTPYGVVYVKHTKNKRGKVVTEFTVPEGVEVEEGTSLRLVR